MGDSRISNALKALAGGLQTIGAARREDEQIEGQRNFQKGMQESNQAFQQRLSEMQMAHQDTTLEKTQAFQSEQGDKDRLFRKEMFAAEQGAANARHAQSMAATWAGIKSAAAARTDAIEDRNLQRQLKVYEIGVTQAAGQYEKLTESMQKEMAEIAKNPMVSLDPKKMAAAKSEVEQRYAPQLTEASDKIKEGMKEYSAAVGISGFDVSVAVDSSAGAGQPAAGAGGAAVDRDRVMQAVELARQSLGSATMDTNELTERFKRGGLSPAEAMLAARQMNQSK